MKKIAIIGDGGWGTALALVLHRHNHHVTIWSPFPDYLETIRQQGENIKFLPGIPLPTAIEWTSRHEDISRAEAIVLASPSKYFRSVLATLASHIRPDQPVLSVTKGFDEKTCQRMTEVAGELLHRSDVAALSGPSLAAEVARGIPAAVTVACQNAEISLFWQKIFNGRTFRIYTSNDPIGVELGGAIKNVIAIAAGICDGIPYGDNTKAALITRGLAEISRLGLAMGAQAATFAGLSGMGDLVVTCTSRLSRNRTVGERLGRGEPLADIQSGMNQVAEGLWTCSTAQALGRRHHVATPIIDEVCAIVHEGKSPRQSVMDLMGRRPKSEQA